METRPYVPWDLMNAFLVDAFKGYGVPAEDAAICADVLLESDRRGIESHGCNRFKPIYIDRIKNGTLLPVTNLEIIRETPSTLVMDAHCWRRPRPAAGPAGPSAAPPTTALPATGPAWLLRRG